MLALATFVSVSSVFFGSARGLTDLGNIPDTGTGGLRHLVMRGTAFFDV